MDRDVTSVRRRYFVFVSALYVILGAIIVARSVTAHVLPVVILGVVLVALGLVRLRDYRRHTGGPS